MLLVVFPMVNNSSAKKKSSSHTHPYAPCIVYLPTFYHKVMPNVGKYTIHSAHMGLFFIVQNGVLEDAPTEKPSAAEF